MKKTNVVKYVFIKNASVINANNAKETNAVKMADVKKSNVAFAIMEI